MPRQNLLFFRSNNREKDFHEKEAIRLCLHGDSRAFEGIVEKYRDRVFWIAYHLVLDYEDARDITQQSFLNAWKSLGTYDEGKPFGNWISKISARCAIDFLRSRKDSEPLEDVALEGFPLERNLDIRKIFLRIAPALSQRRRTVLVLREIYGMDVAEIADLLRCTESTVRNLLSQAKESFRKKIKELFPEYGLWSNSRGG